jgi:hypothetical protein
VVFSKLFINKGEERTVQYHTYCRTNTSISTHKSNVPPARSPESENFNEFLHIYSVATSAYIFTAIPVN